MVKVGATKKKSNSGIRRLIVGATLLFFVCLIGFSVWFFRVGDTKEILAVADQFKPDSSWQLKTNDIQPPKTFCGDVECPSVFRQWTTETIISRGELLSLITKAGWKFDIDGTCIPEVPNGSENVKVCSASGIIDGYNIQITVRTNDHSKKFLIGLNIWKE